MTHRLGFDSHTQERFEIMPLLLLWTMGGTIFRTNSR